MPSSCLEYTHLHPWGDLLLWDSDTSVTQTQNPHRLSSGPDWCADPRCPRRAPRAGHLSQGSPQRGTWCPPSSGRVGHPTAAGPAPGHVQAPDLGTPLCLGRTTCKPVAGEYFIALLPRHEMQMSSSVEPCLSFLHAAQATVKLGLRPDPTWVALVAEELLPQVG